MFKLIISLFLLFFISKTYGQEDLGSIDVIGASPIPGIMINRDSVPNTTQKITENEISQNLSKTITDLMNEKFSGISVKDVQNIFFS